MTSAATADKIVADDFTSTFRTTEVATDLRDLLKTRTIPVIVADNVASYVKEQGIKGRQFQIGGWPCLAPPWDMAFIEYPSTSGNQRRGVFLLGLDLNHLKPSEFDGMVGEAIKDAERQSPGEKARWALSLAMYVDDGRRVVGPVGSVIWAIDAHGKELGNRWFLRPEVQWKRADEEEAMWLHAAVLPALQTISFMHCRNVVVDRHGRPDKLAKAYRRRNGQDPLRWQTVRLELPRKDHAGDGTGPGQAPSLHIVVGHFSHYGDCCPTVHEPKGKLFGKLEGIYWMPQHVRGDPTHEVRSDRLVVLGDV